MLNHSSEPGLALRMSRLFDKQCGLGVIVAMDYGFLGTLPGIEDLPGTLEKVITGEPDGVILNPGAARRFSGYFAGRGAPALVLSIDYVQFNAYPGHAEKLDLHGELCSVEEALRLGAEAVKVMMIFGQAEASAQARNFDYIARTAEQCHRWGLPIMIETTAWGTRFTPETAKTPAVLRDLARIAFEFGADVVKCDYPENPAEFHQVVEACPAPVMVLGGGKRPSAAALLDDLKLVISQGARGVIIGRNVWQQPDPAAMVHALKDVVYASKTK
jgi:fructose-bisphosphate aldolase, class I